MIRVEEVAGEQVALPETLVAALYEMESRAYRLGRGAKRDWPSFGLSENAQSRETVQREIGRFVDAEVKRAWPTHRIEQAVIDAQDVVAYAKAELERIQLHIGS